jgi:lipopolysaccharide heptosyltransferase II
MKSLIPDKTLVIRLSSIGDIVLTSPFLRCFRKKFPDVRLDYVVKKEFAPLLRFNAHISHLYEFDSRGGFEALKSLKKKLRGERYTLIADLHDSVRSRYLRRFLGARYVRKINKRKLARFLLIRFKKNIYSGIVPVSRRYLETVEPFGITDDGEGPELFIPDEILHNVSEKLSTTNPSNRKFIALCPSAKHFTKRWPKEYFTDLGIHLIRQFGVRVLLLGGPEDHAYNEDIRRLISVNDTINLAGNLSLLESAAAMDYCELVISNDTGLMHIAAARRKNLIALFGPTVQELGFFPYGESSHVVEHSNMPCRPCSHIGSNVCPEGHFRCMKELHPDMVLRTAGERFLSGLGIL